MIARMKRQGWPLGVRLQLMLWYTCVFAVLLFISGVILYKHLQTSLAGSLDTALQSRAEQIAGEIYLDHGTIQMHESVGELPGFEHSVNNHPLSYSDVNDDILVRILDAQGKPFRMTTAFRSIHVPESSITQPLQGNPWQDTIETIDGKQDARIYSRSVTKDGKLIAVIQVGQFMGDLQNTLHHVAKEFIFLGVVVLLFSALGSYWLAALAFAPIHNLIRTARSIKEGDLKQRVPVPAARDEVRFLALTLNEMIASLDLVFERQRRFVADASHELRTPVAVIRSTTDVALLHGNAQEDYIAVIRNVNLEAERLGRLINDLLALARGDEGQTKLEHEAVRLDQLADVVTAHAETLAEERQVTLQCTDLQATTVEGDETRLIQMIMNLIDNAIIYTNAGGSISVSVTHNAQQAILTIRDTGIGIAPEHLSHIFERFYRIDPARIHDGGGSSGLGLAIVQWTIQAHRGTINVDSQLGQGSTFTITLPLAPEPNKQLLKISRDNHKQSV
ncbi:sensor histidine kinase [Dictyobacter arantiisoli]|uniref:histidine kinase n=1 Tax=Dictyobacter arantiisoli TaxID=2014874 RepID=A0A5A5T8H1_9CHLR|nr:ATP-binding protein [Dictyobacter arantiisoli]GCF07204.1 two-component sensor histidine kinase [Dictyobacter arantiisoli]